MSRILRRPMFRGGRVDSRGTGITSGLMDKPKRGLVDEPGGYAGEVRTGGDLLKNVNTRFDPFYQNMKTSLHISLFKVNNFLLIYFYIGIDL